MLPRHLPLDDGSRLPLQHVFEFRDPSWYVTDTFALLQEHGAALCLHDMAGSAIDGPEIGPFTYVRFHGAAGKYVGSYGDDALAEWARRLAAAWRRGRDVYAYFNHDPDAVSTRDARRLRELTFAAAGLGSTDNPCRDLTAGRPLAPGHEQAAAQESDAMANTRERTSAATAPWQRAKPEGAKQDQRPARAPSRARRASRVT